MWYTIVAPVENGFMSVRTCNDLAPDFDTDIGVYDGTDCENLNNTLVACNDDGCSGTAAGFWHSEAIAPMRGGDTYLVRVGGFGAGDRGIATIKTSHTPGDIKDACPGGAPLDINGDTFITDTGAYTPDGETPGTYCGGTFAQGDGVWFRFTGDGTTTTVSTCSSVTNYPSAISVFCGGCTNLFCVGSVGPDIFCLDAFSYGADLTFCSAPGTDYFVLVHGDGSSFHGDAEVFVSSESVACGDVPDCGFVPNDNYVNRLPIFTGITEFSTVGATTDGAANALCPDSGAGNNCYNDIWYQFFAVSTGDLTASTCNIAAYDTDVWIYDGCPDSIDDLVLLGCNDDGAGCAGFTSELTVPVTQDNCYVIRVGGWSIDDSGDGDLLISN